MRNNKNSIGENIILLLVAIGVFAIIGGFAGWWSVLMMKSIMIMTIHHQVHTRHIAVHRIIQAVAQEAAVIHQRAILPENIIVVVHQKAVQILRAAVRTAIAIPVAALHIQEALQAAAPVQRNIIIFIR